MHQFVLAIATGLYTGYIRLVPGTFGTIPAWLIGYFLIRGNQPVLAAVTALAFLLSVWAATRAEHELGHDSRKIVIDEWAGMFVAFLLVPYSLTGYILAFVAFRFFDVIKIWPAGTLEKLPRGWGVTMDDVAAGIQANLATQLVLFALQGI